METSSSSSPEPNVIPIEVKSKSKSKRRKKAKDLQPEEIESENSRNSEDPHWAYEPPEDAELIDCDGEFGEFEWDTVNRDKDMELWLIRIPNGVSSVEQVKF
jgi:hypothetical protein